MPLGLMRVVALRKVAELSAAIGHPQVEELVHDFSILARRVRAGAAPILLFMGTTNPYAAPGGDEEVKSWKADQRYLLAALGLGVAWWAALLVPEMSREILLLVRARASA